MDLDDEYRERAIRRGLVGADELAQGAEQYGGAGDVLERFGLDDEEEPEEE